MSAQRLRYIRNNLPDYKGGPVKINEVFMKSEIFRLVEDIITHCYPDSDCSRGGLYVGGAGIAYMFYYLIKNDIFPDKKQEYFQHAFNYLESCNKYLAKKKQENDPAFLLGCSGVHAVSAALLSLDQNFTSKAIKYIGSFTHLADIVTESPVDEVLCGRAGYLTGTFWLNKELKKPVVPDMKVNQICDAMVKSGRAYAAVNRSPCPLMYSYHSSEYLGAAHGLSSILQMLLTASKYTRSKPDVLNDVKQSIDYLLSLQTENGNFPSSLDYVGSNAKPEHRELVHWCHGGPGVIYLMAKAYMEFKEQKYLDSCLKVGDLVWAKGLLLKGPGICHGVSGSGYVFLLLYRLTQNSKHYHRAYKMAEFMSTEEFKTQVRTPDHPYSLYEGTAGQVCFLIDCLKPETSSFPFFDLH